MTTLNGRTDDTKIAVISKDVSYIKESLAEIKTDIKGLSTIFASKEQLVVIARETETRLQKLESQSNLWKWLSPSMAAILASIMTFLIIQYLMNNGG